MTITDEIIEQVSILSKLELTGDEKQQAKKDMEKILDYVNILNQVDTKAVKTEDLSFYEENVLRIDEAQEYDSPGRLVDIAPEKRADSYVVPKTF